MSVIAVNMVLDPGQKLEADLGGRDDGSGPVDSLARDLGVARSGQRLGDEAVHGLGCEAGPWPGRPQPRGEECGPGDAVSLDTEDLVGVPHVPVDGQQGGQERDGELHGVKDGEEVRRHTRGRGIRTFRSSSRHRGHHSRAGVVAQGDADPVIGCLDPAEGDAHIRRLSAPLQPGLVPGPLLGHQHGAPGQGDHPAPLAAAHNLAVRAHLSRLLSGLGVLHPLLGQHDHLNYSDILMVHKKFPSLLPC